MMKAKDKLINMKQLRKLYNGVELKPVLEAQAEISFKAGEKHLLKTLIDRDKDENKLAVFDFVLADDAINWLYDIDTRFAEGKKTGRKEVVEFILADEYYADDLMDGDTNWDEPDRYLVRFSRNNWRAELKEWGL